MTTTRHVTADREVRDTVTTRLLAAAAATGPVFFIVVVAQMLTREGFDLREHPISQLATGGAGWVQMANFVLAGAGVLALSAALQRGSTGVLAHRSIPALVAMFGAGLVLAGAFPMDPEHGFPVGTPPGPAASMSWHAVAHAVAAAVAFTALALACAAAAVRAVRQRRPGAALGHGVVAVVLLVPVAPAGPSIQIAVTGLVAFTWTTWTALSLRRGVRA